MKKKLITVFWVLLIVLIGFRLRLIGINKPSGIWFDEMFVYLQASGANPVEIIKRASFDDILMPLYQLGLAFWMKIFGNSDFILRLFSAVIGSAALVGAYLTGKKAKDEKTGYVAAILFALNGCAIYFSQEVKFYILAMFFCAFNLYFFLRVSEDKKDKTGWAGLITTCVLGCYTFSIYIFLAFVQFAYLFFEIKKESEFRYYWINSGIITTLLIPFLWLNINISNGAKTAYAPSTLFLSMDASTFFNLFHSWMTPFATNKAENFINYFSSFFRMYNTQQVAEIIFIMSFMTFFIIYGLFKNDKARKLGIIGLSFFMLTIFAGIFLGFCFTVRYGVLIVPFLVVLAAIGLCEIKIKWLQSVLIKIFIIFLLFINVFDTKAAPKMGRIGLKPIAEALKMYKMGEGDVLFLPFAGKGLFDKYYDYKGMTFCANIIYEEPVHKSFGIKRTGDIKQDFREYLMSDKPTKGEEYFFKTSINNKDSKGHHIMFVKASDMHYDISPVAADERLYQNIAFYYLPPYKFTDNIIKLCEKKFGKGEAYEIGGWIIITYKIK